MTLPMTALAAILSLTLLPISLQVDVDVASEVSESDPIRELPAGVAVAPDAAGAEPFVDPTLVTGPEQAEILQQVASALSSVSTAKGRFFQQAPDLSLSEGEFYLRRPSRVRFEYDDPVPLLIVADGSTVAIEDRDLETQDRVPLRSTPLALLLDDALDFETEAEILSVRKANGFVAIAMEDKTGETEGVLEIILEDQSYQLAAWRTEDPTGGVTSVRLDDVETGTRISPRLFRIEDPDEDSGRE